VIGREPTTISDLFAAFGDFDPTSIRDLDIDVGSNVREATLANKTKLENYPLAGDRAVETGPDEKRNDREGIVENVGVLTLNPNDFVPIPYKHMRIRTRYNASVRALVHAQVTHSYANCTLPLIA